jgi:diadenosine tetraphosphate (Ap4A) HIT family hydrolase
MNATICKFGWPATLVREFEHWLVLLRPAQPTLGSLVLAAKSEVVAFGDLPAQAHAELKPVTQAIEAALGRLVEYDRINYLMLMMIDPHVHFHVIPRYEGTRTWQGLDLRDAGWPKLPDLVQATSLSQEQIESLRAAIAERFD